MNADDNDYWLTVVWQSGMCGGDSGLCWGIGV